MSSSSATRIGDWKGAVELYDLAQDPGETRDIARSNPVIVKRALQIFGTRSESKIAEWNYP